MKWLVTDKGTYINPLFIESMRWTKEPVTYPVVKDGKVVGQRTELIFKVIAKTYSGSVFTIKTFADALQAQRYLEKLAEEIPTLGQILEKVSGDFVKVEEF
jgi:hypothetical protein